MQPEPHGVPDLDRLPPQPRRGCVCRDEGARLSRADGPAQLPGQMRAFYAIQELTSKCKH